MRRYHKAVHLTICQTSLGLNTINDRRIRLKGQAIDLLGKAGDETWRRSIQSKCSSYLALYEEYDLKIEESSHQPDAFTQAIQEQLYEAYHRLMFRNETKTC